MKTSEVIEIDKRKATWNSNEAKRFFKKVNKSEAHFVKISKIKREGTITNIRNTS